MRAGEIDAATSLNVSAGNDIDITTGTATYSLDQSSQTVKKKTFSKKVTTKRDTVDTATTIASTLTGGTVSMNAGNDLNITGSAVVADDAVLLAAKNDINIQAGIDTNREWNHVEEKKSGFLSGGGGFGISYGTRTMTTDQNRDAVTQSGQARSMVGSIGGDLTLDAGNAIKVGGTDMAAGQDMSLTAKNVTIDPGKDQIDGKLETRVVQDAISLKVGGSVVNAIQAVQSVQQTAKATDNKRVQAMAAATAAMAAKNAAADIQKNGFSVSLSLTAGHSESVQTTTTSETLHTGSVLTAGRDVSIVAKGDGANSDINIAGSEINAGRNVTLAADDQVNLVAAQDLESQHSESKSISAEAGVAASYSSNGGLAFGFTASVSGSKGHEDGDGTTQVNSYVNAGQKLTISSGGDTNIKGAVASASQVVADVGGNLNIESLQDTAKFDSKTQSASVSGTIGYGASVSGSVSQTKITSDYASVQEQSGIQAGDGGFQIKVGGNTDLKGAVISSTEAGIAANSLVTKTLTQSEIENYSVMKASSIGLSGTVTSGGGDGDKSKDKSNAPPTQDGGKGQGPGGTNLLNVAAMSNPTGATPSAVALSNNDRSTTASGISAGTITITDAAAQAALTGESAEQALAGLDRKVLTGSDTSGRLDNNFNAAETQTALQVTEQFTKTVVAAAAPVAAKLVGDIGSVKEAKAKAEAASFTRLAADALANGDAATAALYAAQADAARATEAAWGENGVYRLALHATTQGAIGSMAGGSASALGSAAGVVGGSMGKQLGEFLANARADGLTEAERNELVNTYQHAMATLGGAVAGIAAGSGTDGAQTLANAMQSGTTAWTVDKYNRQLHEKETAWIRENADAFAKEMDISPEEAAKRLAQQAARDTDLLWRGLLPDVDDPEAQKFLQSAAGSTFTNRDGEEQAMFTATREQLLAPQYGLREADRDFVKEYLVPNTRSSYALKGVAEEVGQMLGAAASAVRDDPIGVAVNAVVGIKDGIKEVIDDPIGAAKEKFGEIESSIKTLRDGAIVSVDDATMKDLNDLYGNDVSDAMRLATAVQGAGVISNVADLTGYGRAIKSVAEGVVEAIPKAVARSEAHAGSLVPNAAISALPIGGDVPSRVVSPDVPPGTAATQILTEGNRAGSAAPSMVDTAPPKIGTVTKTEPELGVGDTSSSTSAKNADPVHDASNDKIAAAVDDVADDGGPVSKVSTRPDWLDRLDQGNEFNKQRASAYPYNEVYLESPIGEGYTRLDSYDPIKGEIVSRKFTQLGEVQESTALAYLRELEMKYPPDAKIAKVPSSKELAGDRLIGQQILEVPVQKAPVPQAVIDAAAKAGIVIRDIEGKIYE